MTATITLNGTPHPLPGETTVAGLLESLGLAGKPVVVELDGQAVFPRDHAETRVQNGSRLVPNVWLRRWRSGTSTCPTRMLGQSDCIAIERSMSSQ